MEKKPVFKFDEKTMEKLKALYAKLKAEGKIVEPAKPTMDLKAMMEKLKAKQEEK